MRWFGIGREKRVEHDVSPHAKALIAAKKIHKDYTRRDALQKVAFDAAEAGDHAIAVQALEEIKIQGQDISYLLISNILDPHRKIFVKGNKWSADAVYKYISLVENKDNRHFLWWRCVLEQFSQWGQLDDVKRSITLAGKDISATDVGAHVVPGLQKNSMHRGALECMLMMDDGELIESDYLFRLVTEKYQLLHAQGTPAAAMIKSLSLLDKFFEKHAYRYYPRVKHEIIKLWGLKVVEG